MVVIRLSRGGAKKRPFYHMVVADRRNPRDGRYLERVGYYNPCPQGQDVELKVDLEKVKYWISNGAQPSPRVAKLILQAQAAA